MRLLATAALLAAPSIPLPVTAQEFIGEAGACVILDASGTAKDIETCKQLPVQCNPIDCTLTFEWPSGSRTVITGSATKTVRDGITINGLPATAPAALIARDPRDCLYNETSGNTFCWVPGAQAQAFATGVEADEALRAIAAGTELPALTNAPTDAPATDKPVSPLLAGLQGKYRASPGWNCRDVGADGGAVAVLQGSFIGVETNCALTQPRPVGEHGAVITLAKCSGEGDMWEEEMILRRDPFGTLALLREGGVTTFEACPAS